MNARLGVGIALHTHCLARAFACAGVGGSALAADGQAAQMADAAIALDALQALEVHAQLAAQVTFDDVFAILNGVNDLGQLPLVQIFGAQGGINLGLGKDDLRVGRANAVNVAERNVNALLPRYFNSDDSCHNLLDRLALSLFVALVRANDTNDALAFHNFAVLAKFFD